MKKKKGKVSRFIAVFGVCAAAAAGIAVFFLSWNNPKRIVISRFDSRNAAKTVEYGSRDFNLTVEGSSKSSSFFGRSLKLNLKLIPGGYNFLASGGGLAEKTYAWENSPVDLNWDDIIGVSYKVYVESIKGAPQKVDMIKIATDVFDGDGEILRAVKMVHTGEWLEERVYFKEFTTRYDYQRDWKSVKWTGTDKDKTSLSRIDRGLKSYQFEITGLVSDNPIDLAANQVEVVLYVDEVALIRK
ncbi:MAG: hypothetical protein PHC33_01090 [Candidatus Omnitrophica bacterium]|nr:hypothetical protein [Candidatus Omnitrophota bacterium]